MIDEDGLFVGAICHIEAAKTGGERFRKEMSDEDRRSSTNLLLLCHRHHVVTNEVDLYPVAKLQEMKAAHERNFSQIEEKMSATISDESLETESSDATTLTGLLGKEDEDRPGEIKRVRKYASRLRELPVETRRFLSVAVRRAYEQAVRERDVSGLGSSTVNPIEVQKAIRLTNDEVREQVRILSEHSLASIDDDDGTGRWTMYIYGQGPWPRLPEDIADFCKKQDFHLMRLSSSPDSISSMESKISTAGKELIEDGQNAATRCTIPTARKGQARVTRGSEWRRWDPNIHAPGTILNNQLGGPDPWGSTSKRLRREHP